MCDSQIDVLSLMPVSVCDQDSIRSTWSGVAFQMCSLCFLSSLMSFDSHYYGVFLGAAVGELCHRRNNVPWPWPREGIGNAVSISRHVASPLSRCCAAVFAAASKA